MRREGGYSLLGKTWEGWALWQGKLFTLAGRRFEPYELDYLGNYIAMARLFIKAVKTLTPMCAHPSAPPHAMMRSHQNH